MTIVTFRPNWSDAARETWQYRTEVQQAYDGREIRRMTRDLPRRELHYQYLLPTPAERIWMHRFLARNVGSEVRVPVWMDAARCQVAMGDEVVETPTAGYDYVVGGQLILWRSPGNYHVSGISAITDDLIEIESAPPAPYGLVMPLKPALFAPAGEIQVYTLDMESVDLRFELLPVEHGRLREGEYEEYEGRIIFERPSGEADRRGRLTRRIERADFEVGAWRTYQAWSATATGYDFQWTVSGRERIAETLEFIARHRGRWRWFWWDSLTRDFELTEDAPAAQEYLRVFNVFDFPITLLGDEPPVWARDITVRLRGGEVFRRRLTDWNPTTIFLDAPLGVAVTPADIDRISWLSPTRFDTDGFELRWVTTTLLQVNARFRRVLTVED